MKNLKLFGQRVKQLRKRKNLTQEKLAQKCGIDCKQIGNIETGTYFTTMPTLEKIAEALECEIMELFNFNPNKEKEEIQEDILKLLKNANEQEIKIIYKIIKGILQ